MESGLNIASYIGLPYKHRGCDPVEGIDCWGLVKHFYKNTMLIELPDYHQLYSDCFDKDECEDVINKSVGEWVEVDELSFGSVLTFRILGCVCHVGIHINDGDFIHSFNGTDSCVESVRDLSWQKRFYKAYEWKSPQH